LKHVFIQLLFANSTGARPVLVPTLFPTKKKKQLYNFSVLIKENKIFKKKTFFHEEVNLRPYRYGAFLRQLWKQPQCRFLQQYKLLY
jgi:hypothetical protein